MTGEQRRVYQGALKLGRKYGLGQVWSSITSTGGTPAQAATIAVSGLVYGYAIRNNRDREKQALPQIPIYTAEWLFVLISGAISEGMLLTNGTNAFLIIGAPATDQGWTLAPLATAGVLNLGTASKQAAYQAGLRIGAW